MDKLPMINGVEPFVGRLRFGPSTTLWVIRSGDNRLLDHEGRWTDVWPIMERGHPSKEAAVGFVRSVAARP